MFAFTSNEKDERILELETALLEYIGRYGPTDAAKKAFLVDEPEDATNLACEGSQPESIFRGGSSDVD